VVDGPGHAAAKVAPVGVEMPEPVLVPGADQVGLGRFGQCQVMQRVPPFGLFRFARARQARRGVLPDNVEHVVARVRAVAFEHHQALVDEGADAVQGISDVVDAAGHVLDGVQAPATGKYGQTTEEYLFARPEQVVAPCHGVADRALSQWQVERAPDQEL